MFVLLIGLPEPETHTIALSHARVASIHKILVARQYISRLPTRVPLRRRERGTKGTGARTKVVVGSTERARALVLLTAGVYPRAVPVCARGMFVISYGYACI